MQVSVPAVRPTVTYTLIGVTTAIYLLQWAVIQVFGFDWLQAFGDKVNDLIRAGQIWRLLTPALLHGSIPHLLVNMYVLFALGTTLEPYFGHRRFFLLYVLGAFTGNVLSFLLTSDASLGASTAIFGLIGAEGVFFFQNRQVLGSRAGRGIGNVLLFILISLVGDTFPGSGIDYWGHIGGLLGGLLFTWFAGPRWQLQGVSFATPQPGGLPGMAVPPQLVDQREGREVVTATALVLLIFGALAVYGMLHAIAR